MVAMARSSEESASGNSAPRKKSLPAIIGGAVVVLVAGYFGIDLTSGGSGDSNSSSSESSAASAEGKAISSDSDTCAISTLPDEAHETRDDIVAGGHMTTQKMTIAILEIMKAFYLIILLISTANTPLKPQA